MNLEILTPENKKRIAKSKPNSQIIAIDEWIGLSFEAFNERIGLPLDPQTYEPKPLTPYQVEFFTAIDASKYHRFHINKARQMGFSELILRIAAYRAVCNKYRGKSIKIIAGTRSQATKKLMDRLKDFFKTHPELVNREESKHDLKLVLTNGATFEGLPANPEAITGDTKIACIIMDEAAKWDLVDDQPVLNSIMPIVKTNRSDLFMFSTPKGPRGFFYEIEQNHDIEEWQYFKYDIWRTEGNLYTKEQIEKILKDPTIDVEQEFLNGYTTGRNNIFSTFKASGFEAEVY